MLLAGLFFYDQFCIPLRGSVASDEASLYIIYIYL